MAASCDPITRCRSTVSDLPLELLDAIVCCLFARDQKQLRLTCSRLNDIVTPRLFESLDLTCSPGELPSQMKSCQYFLQHMKTLPLSQSQSSFARHVKSITAQESGLSMAMIHQLLEICPSATSLSIPSFVLAEAWYAIEDEFAVQALPFSQEIRDALSAQFQPLLGGRSGITRLELTGSMDRLLHGAFHGLVPHLHHIRYLVVLVDIPVIDLQRHCPLLEYLECERISDDFPLVERWHVEKQRGGCFNDILWPWTSLRYLSTGFTAETQEGLGQYIFYLCIKFPSLMTLDFQLHYGGSDEILDTSRLVDLSSHATFKYLNSMTIACGRGSDECLALFSHFAPCLTALHLHFGEHDVDVSDILQSFPALQHLCIYNEGLLTCDVLDPEAPTHALKSLDIGERYTMPPSHDGATLETISTLCPSLQRLLIVYDDWVMNDEPPECIAENGLLGNLQKRLDNVLALMPNPPKPMIAALPCSNLSHLGISFCQGISETPGLIMFAEIPDKTTDTTSVDSKVLKAWYIDKQDGQEALDVRPWSVNTPLALEALVNWDIDMDSVVPVDKDYCLGFVGIIFVPSLPREFYLEWQCIPMK